MGVTGTGKTTVGKSLALRCDMTFLDADDHHATASVEKMRAGIPLQDSDRRPWLDRLNKLLRDAHEHNQSVVLACSALKQSYRERLSMGCDDVRYVLLTGTKELIHKRLAERSGHYMNPTLLGSQLGTLEMPDVCLSLDFVESPDVLVERIVTALK